MRLTNQFINFITASEDVPLEVLDHFFNISKNAQYWSITSAVFEFIKTTDLADYETESPRLPYKDIIIEIVHGGVNHVLIAYEQDKSSFVIQSATNHAGQEKWALTPHAMSVDFSIFNNLKAAFSVQSNGLLDMSRISKFAKAIEYYWIPLRSISERDFYVAGEDLYMDLFFLAQTLNVITCSNAPIEKIKAPKHLNKKRARKGKQLIPEYRTLKITPSESDVIRGGGGSSGTRATHWRRGHIRNQPTAKGIVRKWIKPTIVGGGFAKKREIVLT